ncbi:uncharacterized protein [Periplaneta americana]|uniref:uncharacterized protein isoform X2 n=1 Tax=Periplaneta americana TaxID=6978 RepID=UPI0037E7A954
MSHYYDVRVTIGILGFLLVFMFFFYHCIRRNRWRRGVGMVFVLPSDARGITQSSQLTQPIVRSRAISDPPPYSPAQITIQYPPITPPPTYAVAMTMRTSDSTVATQKQNNSEVASVPTSSLI